MIVRDANMVPQPKLDAAGKPVPYHISYPEKDSMGNFLSHANASPLSGSIIWAGCSCKPRSPF